MSLPLHPRSLLTLAALLSAAASYAQGNRAPVAVDDDQFEIREDIGPTCIASESLLANDSDPDGNPIRIEGYDFSGFPGDVAVDGDQVCFVTEPDFAGVAQFSYSITDGQFVSRADVFITVLEVGEPAVDLDGDYVLVPDSDRSLVLRPGGSANRSAVVATACVRDPDAYAWTLRNRGGNVHTLTSVSTGKALETYARSPSAGDPVTVYTPNDRSWQRWELKANPDATFRLVNQYNPLSLTLAGDRAIVSDELATSTWKLVPAAEYTCDLPDAATSYNGDYVIHQPSDPSQVVRPVGDANRAAAETGDCAGGSFVWSLSDQGDGIHSVVNRANGLALESYAATPAAGDPVTVFRPNGQPWQRWRIEADGTSASVLTNVYNPLPLLAASTPGPLQVGRAPNGSVQVQRWVVTPAAEYTCPSDPLDGRSPTVAEAAGVSAYPTSTSDYLTVEAPDALRRIDVIDAAGKRLRTLDRLGDVRHELYVGGLPAGAYFLEVTTAEVREVRGFVRVD